GVFAFATVALHTALAFLICGAGILLARPQDGFMAVVNGDHLGSVLARRLLPAVILLPLLFGWLRLKGQQQEFYDTEFGLALFALSNIFTFAVLVWWNAHLLNQAEAAQQRAAEHIHKLNRILAVLSDINQAIVR